MKRKIFITTALFFLLESCVTSDITLLNEKVINENDAINKVLNKGTDSINELSLYELNEYGMKLKCYVRCSELLYEKDSIEIYSHNFGFYNLITDEKLFNFSVDKRLCFTPTKVEEFVFLDRKYLVIYCLPHFPSSRASYLIILFNISEPNEILGYNLGYTTDFTIENFGDFNEDEQLDFYINKSSKLFEKELVYFSINKEGNLIALSEL